MLYQLSYWRGWCDISLAQGGGRQQWRCLWTGGMRRRPTSRNRTMPSTRQVVEACRCASRRRHAARDAVEDLLPTSTFWPNTGPGCTARTRGAAKQGDQAPLERGGGSPNPPALLRLVGTILMEQDDEWAVADRRYFRPDQCAITQPLLPTTAQDCSRRLPKQFGNFGGADNFHHLTGHVPDVPRGSQIGSQRHGALTTCWTDVSILLIKTGAGARTRTADLLITNQHYVFAKHENSDSHSRARAR